MAARRQDPAGTAGWASAEAPWLRVRSATLSSRIVEQIRAAVFSGQLRPGDFVGTESSLAQHFGVSRMAVRDAIRSLHAVGLIVIRNGAGGGITIAAGDAGRLADALAIQLTLLGVSENDLLDAQFTLELLSAELAARHATDPELDRLRSLIGEASEATDDLDRFLSLVYEFHLALAAASHNEALAIPLRAYMEALRPYYRAVTDRERADRVAHRYTELIALIARRDAPAARALIESHLTEIRRSLFQGAAG